MPNSSTEVMSICMQVRAKYFFISTSRNITEPSSNYQHIFPQGKRIKGVCRWATSTVIFLPIGVWLSWECPKAALNLPGRILASCCVSLHPVRMCHKVTSSLISKAVPTWIWCCQTRCQPSDSQNSPHVRWRHQMAQLFPWVADWSRESGWGSWQRTDSQPYPPTGWTSHNPGIFDQEVDVLRAFLDL